MALAGSSVWPRAASLVGDAMVRSGTRSLWRLLTQNSVPMVACLGASDVESRRFLVVKTVLWLRNYDIRAVLWRHLSGEPQDRTQMS